MRNCCLSSPSWSFPKWMQGVSLKVLWKREEFACVSGPAGPIDEGQVLVESCNFPEPLRPAVVRNGDNIWKIARSQAATDS